MYCGLLSELCVVFDSAGCTSRPYKLRKKVPCSLSSQSFSLFYGSVVSRCSMSPVGSFTCFSFSRSSRSSCILSVEDAQSRLSQHLDGLVISQTEGRNLVSRFRPSVFSTTVIIDARSVGVLATPVGSRWRVLPASLQRGRSTFLRVLSVAPRPSLRQNATSWWI